MDKKINLTNASEWLYRSCGNDPCYDDEIIIRDDNKYPPVHLSLSLTVGQLIETASRMAPVTTFCASMPNNNHHHHHHHNHGGSNNHMSAAASAATITLNNLNRTKSLDNLNFEEKRQLIASTLSLADILQQQSG